MMRTGFPGYGSAPALAKVRRPAMTAGATRSLAAQRRFKRTGGASPGDLRSSSLRSFPKGWKATPACVPTAIGQLQRVHTATGSRRIKDYHESKIPRQFIGADVSGN